LFSKSGIPETKIIRKVIASGPIIVKYGSGAEMAIIQIPHLLATSQK
jgi:hypothetical protein